MIIGIATLFDATLFDATLFDATLFDATLFDATLFDATLLMHFLFKFKHDIDNTQVNVTNTRTLSK